MAAWLPMLVELTLTLTTLVLKLYLDAAYREQPATIRQEDMGYDASVASMAVSVPRSEAHGGSDLGSPVMIQPSSSRVYGRAVSRRAADYVAEIAHPSTCPHCKKRLKVQLKQSASGRWAGAAVELNDSFNAPSRIEPLRDPDTTV